MQQELEVLSLVGTLVVKADDATGLYGTTEVYVPGALSAWLTTAPSTRRSRHAEPNRQGEQSSTSKRPPVLVTCRLCVSRPSLLDSPRQAALEPCDSSTHDTIHTDSQSVTL